MSYNPRPNPSGDTLVASRDQIRGNFEIIRDRFQDNHTDYSSGEGKHKFLQMPEQSSAPSVAVDEGGFYTKTADSQATFYMRSENNGQEYQLSRFVDAQIATFGTNTSYSANHEGGWTFLPGGLIMMYGIRSSVTIQGTITFPFEFPSGAPFSVTATLIRDNTSVSSSQIRSIGSTDFVFRHGVPSPLSVSWSAIGK